MLAQSALKVHQAHRHGPHCCRRAVDEPGAQRSKKRRHGFIDIALHGFSQPGNAQRALRGELRQPLNVRDMQVTGELGMRRLALSANEEVLMRRLSGY